MSDFERIAREHRPRLVRLIRRRFPLGRAAEDVAQEALLKARQKYSTFDGRSLSGWLSQIAINAARDYFKSMNSMKRRPEGGFAGDDVQHLSGDESELFARGGLGLRFRARGSDPALDHERDILRACDRLTAKQRAALELAAFGHTYAEIGRELGCSEDAARDRVARARAAVLEHLN